MAARNLLPTLIRSRWLRVVTVLALLVSMVTGVPPVLSGHLPAAVAVDPACTGSSLPPPSTTTANPGVTTVIQQDAATVEVPPAAVTSPTTIDAASVCTSDLPPLDQGMTNVTDGPRDGYQFAPHMTFGDDLHITVPYDASLIPAGLTEQDVQIYYSDDSTQGQWVPLQRDTLNQTTDQVESLSTHFSNFIAATVTVPDHPENVSFNPTSIKDLKGGDPSAGVDLIAPPQGNSSGDAKLSYPIDLPKGRQDMAPSLQLSYSSAAGNGWLGVGWDLSVPSVSIDTRWGVPRYDAGNETETYLVGDQQLTPLANRGTPQARTAEKTFHTRIEGGFNAIVRHGSLPSNYWWEVTDKEGTRSFYGGDPESGPVAAARLADDAGNIFRWALRESRDLHGNAVHYDYQTVSDVGVAGGTVPGRQLYPRSIDYTRSGSTAGPYTVTFVRDSELANYTRRADVVIDARGGFKMVTAELLSRIEVGFQGQPVRSYDLAYTTGAFGKKLLASVTQRGANNTALGTHTFSYYDDIRDSSGNYNAFAPPVNWTVGADGVDAGLLGHGKASALSGSLSTTTGGHLYAGFNPTKPLKYGSAGGKVGFTHTSTDGQLALVDLNGDDLPDKVFKSGNGISVRFNTSGPDGSTDFGSPVATPTLPGIAKEKADMTSFGPEVYTTVNAFTNHSDTFTEDTTYFSDVNGDGLTDLVTDGTVLFNHLDANGVPTFTTDSNDTPVPIGSGALDSSGLVQDYSAIKAQQDSNNPPVDVLRRWTAPYAGTVKVTGTVALIQDTSAARAAYTGADGVRVAIQKNTAELWSTSIGATDYTTKTPTGVAAITVAKGDRLYFRVGSQSDGAYDQVAWDPVIQYVNASTGAALAASPDANGLDAYRYQASADFTMAGRSGSYVQAPFNGTVRLTGVLHKSASLSDSLTVQVTKNGQVAASWPIAAAGTGDTTTQTDIAVAKQDTIALSITSSTPVDLSKLSWSPTLYYLSSPDVSSVNDSSGKPLIQLHPPFGIDGYATNLTAPQKPWTAPATESDKVNPTLTVAAGTTGKVSFTIKRNKNVAARCTVSISNGTPGTCSFSIFATAGDLLYFDFSVTDPALMSKITSTKVTVTRATGTVVTVPNALYGPATQGLLAAPYRGWTYVGYNGAGARAGQPVVETDLNQAFSSNSTYDPRTAKAYPFLPYSDDKSWRGADDSAWVKASTMSSSREGLDSIGVPAASDLAGARGVSRLSHTSQDAVGAGVSYLSGSTSTGNTASDVDFLDLNGDRFPDIVSNGKVQYTTATGGLDASSRAVSGLGSPRDSDASATNVDVGGSPAHFAANGRGEVDTADQAPARGNKTGSQMVELGLSASLGKGSSKPNHDLLDVNGDGLPDVVSRNGSTLMVALNLGYGFAAAEPWGSATINNGASENGSVGPTLGFNDGIYEFGGGLSLTKDKSQTSDTLEDVNGDGLADRVLPGGSSGMQVALNTGDGFAVPVAWNGAIDGACSDDTSVGLANIDWGHARLCSGNTGYGAGAYFTIGIGPLCGTGCFVILNPGADSSQSMSRDEASLRDIDGDGYLDHLASSGDGTLKVAHNRTGRTNLLKSVARPLGASFTVDYTRDGNTTANPTSRWVLATVTVNDGHSGDGADTQATTYTYSGGVYSRLEREFYGYSQVSQQQLDTANSNALYRKVVRDFATDSYYTHGLSLRERTYDASGGLFADTQNTYVLRDVNSGAEPADGTSTSATIFPMLTRTDERFNEGGSTAVKSTATTNHYDSYGGIDVYTDLGETGQGDVGSADDVIANVGYTSCPTTHVRAANSIVVTGSGTEMRRRESDVDCATGDVTQVRQSLEDGRVAVTDLSYNADGNIRTVTNPPNDNGQRYTETYGYDSVVQTYVEQISDSYGLTSSATHELRFGTVLTQKDENNNVESFGYDEFGRQTSVTGPYEQGGGPATVTFEYHPEAATPWAITRHLDKFRSPTDTIDTVVFIDGVARQIQTKKDSTVYNGTAGGQDVMTVSGAVSYDAFGRQTAVRYPITEPLGTAGTFNTGVDTVAPTKSSYDVLDRVTKTTFPDNTATANAYGFGLDRYGTWQFQQTVTDANTHQKSYYRDVREELVSLKEFHSTGGTQQTIWTSYGYDPLGQLTKVTDNSNNVTRQSFDGLGQRTVVDNPDTGKTITHYDLASNPDQKITANLAATGQQITYDYDFERLKTISYPRFPANNVSYTYGAPGASDNRAGRITHVVDQAGSEDRYYGKLGETTKEVRTVVGYTGSSPKTYTTSYLYDTFGRMQNMTYPDGEVLTYAYDSGGMVRAASGVKGSDSYHYVNRVEYDKFGQQAFVEDGNGVQTRYTYDPVMDRLSNQVAGPLLSPNKQNLGNFENLGYSYDNVGNVTAVANSIAVPPSPTLGGPSSQTFNYDDLDRLTSASGSYSFSPDKTNKYSYAMSYDNLHNITAKNQTNTIVQGSGTPVTQGKTTYSLAYAYTGAQPHAPSHIGTQTYTYDLDGNQNGWTDDGNGQRRTIVWDEENRIQSVTDNGNEQDYKYDDAGQRVIKRSPKEETDYVNQYFTVRSNGQIGTKHVFIGTTRVASKLVKDHSFEKDSFYFHSDHLSSTNYVTDAAGKLYEHLEYFPSGESWVEEKSNSQQNPGFNTAYEFAGKELDEETQLYYFGARYYDARTSVWQSPDPALGENLAKLPKKAEAAEPDVAAPTFLNLYDYADANPLTKTDPDGRKPARSADPTAGECPASCLAHYPPRSMWHLAPSLMVLHDQLYEAFPDRYHPGEGKGDPNGHHLKLGLLGQTWHVPDAKGVIHAFDVYAIPGSSDQPMVKNTHTLSGDWLAKQIVDRHDPRVYAVIFNGTKWWSREHVDKVTHEVYAPWTPTPYRGTERHAEHVHVELEDGLDAENDIRPWFTWPPAGDKQ
ncbi:SpvB/TcaC N-terminal domain-containing protein [Jatrophihabitans sp.]|uniref:SpvB/TcaC N-terminal domain-containing protein n=1 Tax=Jatrophihabitans sp. TaxID=1932789 RepID=UPI002C2E06EF|nr:SpvB/TcaC N-terminal domain-containing protein [Jatrophihabitans sp.]